MSIGLIGIKTGMTRVFDDSGLSIPVTVINIDSNRISQIKTKERDGYSAIQVAYGSQKESRLSKALIGHYKKSNIKPAKGQHEFKVKNLDESMSIGTDIKVDRLKSGETRKIYKSCRATIGEVGNSEYNLQKHGKAGAKRWLGVRPTVRGVAMNPIDHPHGGGEGKTSGGRDPVSPWGTPTKGYKTRSNKRTDNLIVRRRVNKNRK